MDLNVDILRQEHGATRIALVHNYELNDDLVPDPDMEIRVYFEDRYAVAMTYQDTYGFQRRKGNKLDVFLGQWLNNIQDQGHQIPAEPHTETLLKTVETEVLTAQDDMPAMIQCPVASTEDIEPQDVQEIDPVPTNNPSPVEVTSPATQLPLAFMSTFKAFHRNTKDWPDPAKVVQLTLFSTD